MSVLRDRAGAAGGIIAAIGGAIWSLVTFLVVPVLAFEDIGPIDAIKRSAHLFRERWGQQVTGNVVIGGISGLAALVGIVLAVVGVVVIATGGVAIAFGAVLLAVGVVICIGAAIFGGATRASSASRFYRYVAEDRALGPFTASDLDAVARTR